MAQTNLEPDLERRLTALERSVSRYRRSAIVLALVLLGSGLLFGQVLPTQESSIEQRFATSPELPLVVRDSITIVDDAGVERAVIAATSDGSALVLFDTDGRPRAGIDAGYTTSLTLYDEGGGTRAILGATTMVASHVESADGSIERRPISSLVLFSDAGGVLERLP